MQTRTRDIVFYGLKGACAGVIMIGLIGNIVGSQLIPSSYFAFVQEDKTAAVELLRAMKLRPEFPTLAGIQRSIYGPSIDQELFAEERGREERINELEELLKSNPKSRDVLYALSVLYKEKKDMSRSDAYLKRAREIDPLVGAKEPN